MPQWPPLLLTPSLGGKSQRRASATGVVLSTRGGVGDEAGGLDLIPSLRLAKERTYLKQKKKWPSADLV